MPYVARKVLKKPALQYITWNGEEVSIILHQSLFILNLVDLSVRNRSQEE